MGLTGNNNLLLNLVVLFGFLSATNSYASLVFIFLFFLLVFPLYLNFVHLTGLSFLITYLLVGQALSGGFLVIEETIRMLVLILVLLGLALKKRTEDIKVHNATLHIIFLILLCFSIAAIFNFETLLSLRNVIWPLSLDNLNTFDYGVFGDAWFRIGSIFYNPNVFGQALVFLTAFYLFSDSKYKIPIIIILILLTLLTGSRTATFTLGVFLFFSDRNIRKLSLVLIFPASAILIIVFSDQILFIIRALDILSAISGESSGSVKLYNIIEYIYEFSTGSVLEYIILLLGHGFIDQSEWHMDSEVGLLIYSVGLIGLTGIMLIIFYHFLNTQDGSKSIYLLFLFSIGSTLLLSLKFAPLFLILTFLSKEKSLTISRNANV
jgi:hypothetical protein